MDTPEDNTAVIRMKRDFDSFLSNTSRQGLPRFDLDRSLDMSLNQSSQSALSIKVLLDREKEGRLKDAEMAASKSKILQLQSEVDHMRTSCKRAKIEMDLNVGNMKGDREREEEMMKELKAKLKYMSDKEKNLKEELEACRGELKQKNAEFEAKMLAQQKEKVQKQQMLQQLRDSSKTKIFELQNDLMKCQTETQQAKVEVEQTSEQLQLQLKRSADLSLELKELEEYRNTAQQAEHKIKMLEQQVSRMSEDAIMTQAMKSQIISLPALEKEVRKLREENEYLRGTNENNLLLKEQAESMKKKLERLEQRTEEFAKMEVENTEMKHRLEKWESVDSDGVRIQNPTQMSQRIAHLQEMNAVLLEKQGELQSSFHLEEENGRCLQYKYEILQKQHDQDKIRSQHLMEQLKRFQRKLLLFSKERDGYKQIIDSYESELTSNIGSLTTSRVQHLEGVIDGYRKQAETLEATISKLTQKLTDYKMQGSHKDTSSSSSLSTDGNGVVPRSHMDNTDQKIILQLRERIETLEKQLEKTEEEKYILESRMEQRHLQGDFDPTKTKVLHFSMNPVALAQAKKKEIITELTEENEKLKHRLKLLEESEGKVDDLTMQVEQKMEEPCSSKEIDGLKEQLSREETKNKRLMEVFKKTSQEFREVCYQLTGYKIDILSSNQYKLTSMYAESPEDFFLFQQSSSGEVQMLGTDFSNTLEEAIELYLAKQDSIPAFLSSITLNLFSRQTMMIG
ncbi:mitotic spindle assembly checkpoint protein MAD1-like [Mizuhopecten yessoensis]|uniref:Mitotic spindle assembly checkpoint protein MAD1 n=1 Tax=Mizuhopecten yessoensis TaxID=6573 RepID=A0A210QSU9_MIZYE|nr:mitotic spindle assembly checkpoint protein MAD1-like [Mizuhopecten yessoensis]OWF51837.1 Mitotic spindle assembly checkpoint protein MAD1 [Mizuhopecten yessoensis]